MSLTLTDLFCGAGGSRYWSPIESKALAVPVEGRADVNRAKVLDPTGACDR